MDDAGRDIHNAALWVTPDGRVTMTTSGGKVLWEPRLDIRSVVCRETPELGWPGIESSLPIPGPPNSGLYLTPNQPNVKTRLPHSFTTRRCHDDSPVRRYPRHGVWISRPVPSTSTKKCPSSPWVSVIRLSFPSCSASRCRRSLVAFSWPSVSFGRPILSPDAPLSTCSRADIVVRIETGIA